MAESSTRLESLELFKPNLACLIYKDLLRFHNNYFHPFMNAAIGKMNNRSFDGLERFEEKMGVATNGTVILWLP